MTSPEWLIERGIGETRAVLVDNGEIVEARIELDGATLAVLEVQSGLSASCVAVVEELGFPSAHVDPQGFRSGSMNELLVDRTSFR